MVFLLFLLCLCVASRVCTDGSFSLAKADAMQTSTCPREFAAAAGSVMAVLSQQHVLPHGRVRLEEVGPWLARFQQQPGAHGDGIANMQKEK